MEASAEPGWYVDPTGRHEHRYWTGADWSRHVDDAGLRSVDTVESLTETGPTYVVPAARPRRGSSPRRSRRPRRRRRRSRFALVAVILAVAIGLAGGAAAGLILTLDDSTDGDTAVAAPVDPLASSLEEYIVDTSVGEVGEDDASCMTSSIIDTVGREALVNAGVDRGADPLIALNDDQVQTGLREAFVCLDDATLTAVMKQTFSPSMLASLGVASTDCLIDGWMTDLGRDTLIEVYALWASRRDADIAGALSPTQFDALAGVVGECQATHPATTAPAGG
ncbi:MAG: DUF2510 domain-containing protein [Acidimicrobiales bacterium]